MPRAVRSTFGPLLIACALSACLAAPALAQGEATTPDAPPQAAAAADATGLTRWSFQLPRNAMTSAGVYTTEGRLVRTLWRGESLAAGEHQRTWNGRDDAGRPVPAGEFEILVLHHRVNPVWEGVVGNTSDAFGGPTVHKSYLPPSSLAVQGDQMHYAVGYNEAQPGLHRFALATPQRRSQVFASTDAFVSVQMIAIDATRLYWANTGGVSRNTFVGAFDLDGGRRSVFAAGSPICLNYWPNSRQCRPEHDYPSVIDLRTDPVEMPTGIAVQRNGRVLAVAHGGIDRIRLFDKGSGAPLHEWAASLNPKAVNQIAMSASGDLWVISGRSVLRYTDIERQPVVAARIEGLSRPIALGAAAGSDDSVWVADGGSSQQIKRFDRDGKPSTVLGRAGGYASDPAVTADKLCFKDRPDRERTAMAAVDNASLWVVDTCNNRLLRFKTSGADAGRSDTQIAYLPAVYLSTVDHRSPRRVFANFLEFEVDNTQPLAPGRSWRLVRNWLGGLPASLSDEQSFNGLFGGLTSVETFSNGRTFGLMQAQGRQMVVELPASGPLRAVRQLAKPLPGATGRVLYENGDLGHALTGASTQSALRQPFIGFDAAGDPLWSPDLIKLASVPLQPGTPHYRGAFSGMPPRFPVTGSGRVVFFDQAVVGNEGFHLGAVAMGGTDWLWQASPTGPMDGKGSFQTKAVDNSTHYGGNAVWAHGRHIVYGYHGEFYRDLTTGRVGQANQFMHFDESGLFLSQFGQPSTRPSGPGNVGLSGNAFSPTLVRDGTRLYLYHNDESSHGGVHRWRIDGWDDIGELRGRGPVGGQITLR